MNSYLKSVVRQIAPKMVAELYSRYIKKTGFWGNYASWKEASEKADGYDSKIIFDKVKDSLLKVKKGEAAYERDSVLFDQVEYSWPLLATLLWIASENANKLNILDFGGSLGSTYFQNLLFLRHLPELHWNIVEQAMFVHYGNECFADEHLQFFPTIGECIAAKQPRAILLSSVISYMEEPYDLLVEIERYGFQYIIFDRTPFVRQGDERLTIQRVSPSIYKASYPAWFFNEKKFLHIFSNTYNLIAEFAASDKANIPCVFKGFIFKRK